MLRAIEDACSLGVRRVDLGGGEHDYKLRLADGNDPIAWCGLMPRTRGYPAVRAQMLPSELSWLGRRTAKRLLRRRS
jgi:CelD/BcsL family acetyltransferase involved in cellulose biosynthesis